MEINRQAFESHFKTTEIYKREVGIRKKDILEFSNTMNGYFNIVANDAWRMWQQAQKVAVPESRTDFEIINQTIGLVDLLASSINVYQRDPNSEVYPFESKNPRVNEWWRTACKIQDFFTRTDPENCDFEEYKAMIEAQEQVG